MASSCSSLLIVLGREFRIASQQEEIELVDGGEKGSMGLEIEGYKKLKGKQSPFLCLGELDVLPVKGGKAEARGRGGETVFGELQKCLGGLS